MSPDNTPDPVQPPTARWANDVPPTPEWCQRIAEHVQRVKWLHAQSKQD